MKQKFEEKLEVPQGIECNISEESLTCKKGNLVIERKTNSPLIKFKVSGNELTISCVKGNKNQYKVLKSLVSHLQNIFQGLEKPFIYKLEIANVHFPMTVKSQDSEVIINNFLGEKTPRKAKILPNVEVKIQGNQIEVSSHDKELAGQTAANIEKATKVRGRDRRIFQDGIFITAKPERIIEEDLEEQDA
jgi:large subunit ribosomal protein L6